jgi:hypothetical protein
MVGTPVKPKLVNSAVLAFTVSFCASAAPTAVMPPCWLRTEASFCSMVVTGSCAARMVAPWATLFSPIRPTGIQTKRACDFSGFTFSHRWAQCGHCGSKKT